ncbi:MAG: nucleotidyltransferase, partial [Bacteroidia bacterium]|nr:nucleotidyltransferase [Bacteroidia bacterium]
QRILELKQDEELVSSSSEMKNSVIIPPCFIGDNTVIENSVIGPHVSIEANSKVNNSVIKNSIIQANSTIYNGNFSNSMVGNYAEYSGETKELSIGDYCTNGPLKE